MCKRAGNKAVVYDAILQENKKFNMQFCEKLKKKQMQ